MFNILEYISIFKENIDSNALRYVRENPKENIETITNTTRYDYYLRHILYLLWQMHFWIDMLDTTSHVITISLYLFFSFK